MRGEADGLMMRIYSLPAVSCRLRFSIGPTREDEEWAD